MSKKSSTANITSFTRLYRKLHRWVAIPTFAFMMLIGATGLLLGWKKHANLLPKTEKGSSEVYSQWVSIDSLARVAQQYMRTTAHLPDEIDRIDIRPAKATAKIVFAQHFTELQLDCHTGKILAINTRKSDFIEKIHDGSILDFWWGTSQEQVKLFYTTVMSVSLMVLSFSGFWLWYNPIRIRKRKQV